MQTAELLQTECVAQEYYVAMGQVVAVDMPCECSCSVTLQQCSSLWAHARPWDATNPPPVDDDMLSGM